MCKRRLVRTADLFPSCRTKQKWQRFAFRRVANKWNSKVIEEQIIGFLK